MPPAVPFPMRPTCRGCGRCTCSVRPAPRLTPALVLRRLLALLLGEARGA